MSTFEVKVRRIEVMPHPDPETTALEVGKVDDYMVVNKKGQFQTGDLIAYIPEASVLPKTLIEELGLVGRLAGSNKDRVKAIKLRKVLSQGLCLPAKEDWVEGQDVAEILGITKWVPVIPAHMAGEVQRARPKGLPNDERGLFDIGFKFDIENIKKYGSKMFADGDDVTITEKIHGTFIVIGLMPDSMRHEDMISGKFFVSSKGLASQGLFMKDNERNTNNLYVKTAKSVVCEKLEDWNGTLPRLIDQVEHLALDISFETMSESEPVWLVGEVFGNGVQDLRYGQEKTSFRAFGLKVGEKWLDYDVFLKKCKEWDIPHVPVLYQGPYSKKVVDAVTKGKTVVGKGCHIREGVVICATKSEDNGGRRILKSVSEDYLLRKSDDATEYE